MRNMEDEFEEIDEEQAQVDEKFVVDDVGEEEELSREDALKSYDKKLMSLANDIADLEQEYLELVEKKILFAEQVYPEDKIKQNEEWMKIVDIRYPL